MNEEQDPSSPSDLVGTEPVLPEADLVGEPPPHAETDRGAIWALVLAILSYFFLPLVGAVVALFLAAGAQHRIEASGGTLGGTGMVTAAKILAWVNLGLLAIGAVGVIVWLVATNSTDVQLDLERAERTITENLQTEYVGFEVDRVTCPDDVTIEAGSQFTCTTMIEGQELEILVTQDDDEGNVSFEKAQAAIPVGTAEEFIVNEFRQQGTAVTTTCGDREVVVVDPGSTIECAVTTDDGNTTTAIVTVNDVLGNVSLDFELGE